MESDQTVIDVDAYLWKTDTQLSGPLAHCARYPSNFGCRACINGPMSGILSGGPAIGPFRLMYITKGHQQVLIVLKALLTLIID